MRMYEYDIIDGVARVCLFNKNNYSNCKSKWNTVMWIKGSLNFFLMNMVYDKNVLSMWLTIRIN